MSQTSEAHRDNNENTVTEIHQGERIEVKSGPESATGDTSLCASYFCLYLSSLSFYFPLAPLLPKFHRTARNSHD